MKYRYATIHAAESLDSAGTKTIPINLTDPISRIDIRFEVTKVVGPMSGHPAKDITKIELVDGSEVLHSLNGYENQALAIYSRRIPTMVHGQHIIGNAECSMYGIDFGRFLNDPQLAFLATQFKNPQLKITYTLTSCDGSGAAAELEVFAHCFDEKMISPIGFLMAKEAHSYTCGAENSYESVQLPRDYPIRKMIIRAFHDAYSPWRAISEVRLDEDNLKRIPIDVLTEDYARMMKGVWLPVEEQVVGSADNDGVIVYVTPTDYYAILSGISVDSGKVLSVTTWQPGGKFNVVGSDSTFFMATARGYLPNHCFEFLFGDPQDLEDWYDLSNLASLRLRMKAGASTTNGIGEVVLEQLRRY